jgi:membrane protease YdiL (CAAX protease family)
MIKTFVLVKIKILFFMIKKRVSTILFFTFLGFIPDILNNLSEYLFNYSFLFDNEEVFGMGKLEIFITSVIIAPVIETLFFQAFFFQGLLNFNFFKKNKWLIVIISASVFASLHGYTFHYILFAFYGGLILGIAYLKTLNETNYKTAILVVFSIHLLRNLIIFLLIDVFHLL